MNASIQEKSFSFAVQYNVQSPTTSFQAKKKVLSLKANIEVHTPDNQPLGTIKSTSFVKQNYEFSYTDGRKYEYHCTKMIEGSFIAEGQGETYHLYSHRGVKYSIFKGETQVAAITKQRLAIGSGTNYDLRIDPDADLLVISSMILAMHSSEGDKKDKAVNFSVGKVGPEERKVDDAWKPSDEA